MTQPCSGAAEKCDWWRWSQPSNSCPMKAREKEDQQQVRWNSGGGRRVPELLRSAHTFCCGGLRSNLYTSISPITCGFLELPAARQEALTPPPHLPIDWSLLQIFLLLRRSTRQQQTLAAASLIDSVAPFSKGFTRCGQQSMAESENEEE